MSPTPEEENGRRVEAWPCLKNTLPDLLARFDSWASLLWDIQTKLTAREREVLAAFIETPCTSKQTIRNQLASIRQKLGIGSTELLMQRTLLALMQVEREIPRTDLST